MTGPQLGSENRFLGLAILVGLAGIGALAWSGIAPASVTPERYVCYAVVALVSAALRITRSSLPGGTSMAFLFILVSLMELSEVQTLVLSSVAVLIVSPLQAKRRHRLLLTLSDLLAIGAGTMAAHAVYRYPALSNPHIEDAVRFVAAAAACFFAMAIPAFLITGATDPSVSRKKYAYSLLLTMPYYLVAGAVTGAFAASANAWNWQSMLAYMPFALLLWRSYRMYMSRLETHRHHSKEIDELHLRTIETLALAIGARDREMSRHLERVQVYAVELGKALGLSRNEQEGLKAAALLHDIGKLGVPEHIISKPGRLTPEEFEKMRVHPMVGAEILQRAEFPYPVVEYVRHHHERWDGSGYPDGLKGEAIPIGARILTVVDCLDALASDRQYRRAIPVEQAVEQMAADSGKQFDPRIFALLRKHYQRWERRLATTRTQREEALGQAPAEVFNRVVRTIGSTTAEVNSLFELTQELGTSLSLAQTFSVVSSGLRSLVKFHGIAVYLRRRDRLQARHLDGFPSKPDMMELEIGEGLSGRVAGTGGSIVNGNPARESTNPLVAIHFQSFRSALSIALPGPDTVLGVLTLYHTDPDAFTTEDLRRLQALIPKLSQAVTNGMLFQQAEDKAGTDHLTGLPNAHSLYLHLDHQIGLSKCMGAPLAVIVCDLNGFKQVNDTLGHLVGNQLLQAVGAALRESCREYDFVARMGGDEFVMIVSDVHEDTVVSKIRALRESIKVASVKACRDGMIYGSFGFAMYPKDAQTADELLACADRNMYRDKEEQKQLNGPALSGVRAWRPNLQQPSAPNPSQPAGTTSSHRIRPASREHSFELTRDKG